MDGTRFVAAVDHAIGAGGVAGFGAVVAPVGGGEKFGEGFGVAVLQQVAGLLPSENVVGGHAPWGAGIGALAHKKFEEERGQIEFPLFVAVRQDGAEHAASAGAAEKMFLV